MSSTWAGGADALLARAQKDFARGEHRWVAEVLSHLVFADPANQAARQLCAASPEHVAGAIGL